MAQTTVLLPLLIAIFTLGGLYIAFEEALEATMTADYVAEPVRGMGYGVLGTVNGIGDLVSSTAVGFLWTAVSPIVGFGVAAVLMGTGTIVMGRLRA